MTSNKHEKLLIWLVDSFEFEDTTPEFMSLILGIMPFGWLYSIMLTTTYSIISYWKGIFYL